MGSWNGAGSGADSLGSRNGADSVGSRADSVGSWNGTGFGADSILKAEPLKLRARSMYSSK